MGPEPPSPGAPDPYAPPADTPTSARGAPSRLLAFALSLFAAGAGQFYKGRARRGAGWLALAVGMPVVGAVLPAASRAGLFGLAFALFALVALARPLSAIDAVRIAPRADGHRPDALRVGAAFAIALGLIVGSALVTRRFLLEAFTIPSGSMTPTILVGDHVFVDKTAKAFHRGRPVVFRFPEHAEQDFVKRVVATGGDRLEMREGHPWINGWEVPHCAVGQATVPDERGPRKGDVVLEYLGGEAYLTFLDAGASGGAGEGSWVVKAGEAFVLGDNRRNAYDSRSWFGGVGGGVPAANALGEPIVVWLSVTRKGGLEWSREGHVLARPTLPRAWSALEPDLARCLASRPPREATEPPPPR